MTAESVVRAAGFSARFSDRLNPIVIKELRQAVQSRFVVAALMTLLSIQLVALAIFLLASGDVLLDFDAGRQVFMLLHGILLGIGMLFVPLYTGIRLAAERSDANVDLLFITTIQPRSIITGKLLAAIVLTVLIFSACMPFLVFTYFLRGIDLPSIFVVLALGFLVIIACTQLAIFVASLPLGRGFKALFGVGALLLFAVMYFTAVAGSSELVTQGIGSKLGRAAFWQGAGLAVLVFLFWCGLFFSLSVALIMPPAANRALPVRAFITGSWLVSGVVALLISVSQKDHSPLMVWQIVFNIVFAIALFVAVSERESIGRRVQRAIPALAPSRSVAFFFYSGAASGLAWAALMIVATLGLAWLWGKSHGGYMSLDDLQGSVKWLAGMCLYVLGYALAGAALRRVLFRQLSVGLTWLLSVFLMALGCIVPFLLGYLLFSSERWTSESFGAWMIGNPFAWGVHSYRPLYFLTASSLVVLTLALNARGLLAQIRAFQPLPAATTQTEDA